MNPRGSTSGEQLEPKRLTLLPRQVEGEKEKPGLIATLRNLNRRRMLSVFMTTIYSQLCGIGIVTAYLIDIFESKGR